MKTQKGFTLIEVVIMLAIVSAVVLILSQSFIASLRTNISGEIRQEVKQSGGFAIDTISRMILQARGIDELCPAEEALYSSLTLQSSPNEKTTIECKIDSNNILRIASTSATSTVYLTGSEVELNSDQCDNALLFTCQSVGDGQKRVTVRFSLRQLNPNAGAYEKAPADFQTTITTRN